MATSSSSSFPPSEDGENEQYLINKEELPTSPPEEQVQIDQPVTGEDQLSPPPSAEAGLPPKALYETNGGPLGCCLGVTVGIMLSLFLGVIGFGQVVAFGLASLTHTELITNIRLATALFAVIGAFIGGYAGWKIGQRIYREYELSSRQKERLARLEERYRPKRV